MTVQTPSRSRSAVQTERHRRRNPALRGQWFRFVVTLVVTAVAVAPIAVVVYASVVPRLGGESGGLTLGNFIGLFLAGPILLWLRNSALVTLVVVVATVVLAAPAGYVLSRGRGALLSGYALLLFVMQSLPVVVLLIPLFFAYARIGLVDNLAGVTVIYVGLTTSAAIWMMGGQYDAVPIEVEEAAWVDGASVLGGFLRVVLPSCVPGLISIAMFAFLTTWNDYVVVLVFIRSASNYTLPLGLELFGPGGSTGAAYAIVMMLPPVVIFAALNRYFSIGGIGGSLTGR